MNEPGLLDNNCLPRDKRMFGHRVKPRADRRDDIGHHPLSVEGPSNQEIGDALVFSNRTVASHVEHILDKLSAPNRAAAAAYALREGLILGRVVRYDR